MHSFLTKFAAVVRGVLCGFDRLFFCGRLRQVAYIQGMQNYLRANHILYKDFADHCHKVNVRLQEASLRQAQQLGREIRYLNSTQVPKEDIARAIANRDRIRNGLICVLRSVDPCMSFEIRRNRQTRKLELHYRRRKCVYLYHYLFHPVFGFMHVRIQTWFPFCINVCMNGREWLARQMDRAKLHYLRRDNTFTWLEDIGQTEALFNQQVQADWSSLLDPLVSVVNPAHTDIFAEYPCRYYWSATETEWASDVMFQSPTDLQTVYPRLRRYAITTFDPVQILRFFSLPVPASGKVPHTCRHDITSNVKERREGVRIKHWLNSNSLKMYDKGSVLRVETMIRAPGDFKVYRTAEGDPDGPEDWRPLRKGVVDMTHRAETGQAANERYLEALTAVQDTTPLHQLVEPLCQPVLDTATHDHRRSITVPPANPPARPTKIETPDTPATPSPRPRRVRALNPLATADAALLQAVSRHEFLINGLRNRDLRRILYPAEPPTPAEARRQSAAVTRQLRLLRAHGLICKVPKTHRYLVTESARRTITALLAARNASADQLTHCAA